MIVVTGAAGFIGSCMVSFLNRKGIDDLIIVDHFEFGLKSKNLDKKRFFKVIDRNNFVGWFQKNASKVSACIHLALEPTQLVLILPFSISLIYNIPYRLLKYAYQIKFHYSYASSAATYGDGTLGYDDQLHPNELHPLNPYGESKNEFDR